MNSLARIFVLALGGLAGSLAAQSTPRPASALEGRASAPPTAIVGNKSTVSKPLAAMVSPTVIRTVPEKGKALSVPGGVKGKTASPEVGAVPVDASVNTAVSNWTYEGYLEAFRKSGRSGRFSAADFAKVAERKKKAEAELEAYLRRQFGHADARILRAFDSVPREYFHYQYAKGLAFSEKAYEIPARPWAVGYGSALSDYMGQAYMIQLANPQPEDRSLEVGTGSGYNAALLSRLVKESYSIEIIKPLGTSVAKLFEPLGYANVSTRVGDGFFGWPEVKEGFDLIIVTCAAQFVPPALLKQLKPKGRMIIPIGQPFRGKQLLFVYTKDEKGKVHSRRDMGVFFIPMTGEMQKQQAIREAARKAKTPTVAIAPTSKPGMAEKMSPTPKVLALEEKIARPGSSESDEDVAVQKETPVISPTPPLQSKAVEKTEVSPFNPASFTEMLGFKLQKNTLFEVKSALGAAPLFETGEAGEYDASLYYLAEDGKTLYRFGTGEMGGSEKVLIHFSLCRPESVRDSIPTPCDVSRRLGKSRVRLGMSREEFEALIAGPIESPEGYKLVESSRKSNLIKLQYLGETRVTEKAKGIVKTLKFDDLITIEAEFKDDGLSCYKVSNVLNN